MKAKDWVWDGADLIGKVKGQPYEVSGHGRLIDVVLYNHQGDRIGRQSPRMGGPASFEPACGADDWQVIEHPNFPLPKYEFLGNLLTVVDPTVPSE